VDVEILEARVRLRLRRHLRDVQLVVDVTVDVEAAFDDGVDRLERDVARDRHVTQDLAAHRVRDERALVADDRIVEAGFEDIRPHRTEHAAGDDDHMRSRLPNRRDRGRRARAQRRVLADEGAVEVGRERADLAGKARRKLDCRYGVPPVAWTT
jgi:hypothetical protein